MNNRINPQYWLRIAREVAKASTCKANVGCVLVHKKMIVGIGYVGSIHGDGHCDADGHINVPAEYRGEGGETCIRTIHAEVNAILKCHVRGSAEDGFIECYSTHQPCCECLKLLLQIGVHNMYYIEAYADARRDRYIEEAITRGWWNKIHLRQIMMES